MTEPVTTEVVEARLRATLHRRAADVGGSAPRVGGASVGADAAALGGVRAGGGADLGAAGASVRDRLAAGRRDRLAAGRRGRRAAQRRPWLGAAAAAVLVVAAAGVAVTVWPDADGGDDVVTAGQDADGAGSGPDADAGSDVVGAGPPAGGPPVCGSALPATITVPGAIDGPVEGPAPGQPAAGEGELVVHWLRTDGAVEARWPAPVQPLYGERLEIADPTVASGGMSAMEGSGRYELDLGGARNLDARFVGDVVVEDAVHQPAPCDAILLTTTGDLPPARLTLQISPPGSEYQIELVDRNPIIVEQRPVDTAPTEAAACRGADANGTPPNRYGEADPTVRAAEPAEVLRQFLAGQPGSIPSGFVELQEPDGTVTYAVDPSAIHGGDGGWTTIVHVDRDVNGTWFLAGWTTSGC